MSNYIYDYSHVSSGRKEKSCDNCFKTIPKGASSITITYHSDDGFNTASVCSESCRKKYYKDFEKENEE